MFDETMKLEKAVEICIELRKKLKPLESIEGKKLKPLENIEDGKKANVEKDALEKLIDCALEKLYHD